MSHAMFGGLCICGCAVAIAGAVCDTTGNSTLQSNLGTFLLESQLATTSVGSSQVGPTGTTVSNIPAVVMPSEIPLTPITIVGSSTVVPDVSGSGLGTMLSGF